MAEPNDGSTPGAKFFLAKTTRLSLTFCRCIPRAQNQSAAATNKDMGQASQVLESIFGDKCAWFGGWALKIRGSKRDTEDLDIIVDAPSAVAIWDMLLPHDNVTLYYHRQVLEGGGSNFEIFVEAESGQLVCVDVLVAGGMSTPKLSESGAVDEIQCGLPEAGAGVKRVVSLRWQVRQKLAAGASRRKMTDYQDLEWLCDKYTDEIKVWIKEENEAHRMKFYKHIYDDTFDEDRAAFIKECMGV